ncbi:MFS transporter [Nocardioides sp. DS6]|uniref:MFS transporter n=1 Tax=Nocardioides eburneus TaxID=3231482 RepID=A0ABV3SXJ7_9ACTN
MGFAATAMGFPLMLYAQLVRGYSAFEASLLMVPMAVISFFMAPVVGRFTDKVHPKLLVTAAFAVCAIAVFWVSTPITSTSHVWELLVPMGLLGLGMSGVWAPLAATATRNLPMHLAGAGAGVYNATRLVGSVIGSAGIAVLMDSRITAERAYTATGKVNPDGLSSAMSQSILLPAAVLALGFVASLLFATPKHMQKA